MSYKKGRTLMAYMQSTYQEYDDFCIAAKQWVAKQARLHGQSISEFMRGLVLDKYRESEEFKEMQNEINNELR